MWQMKGQALQLYWMKIEFNVNSSVKNNSLSPRHVWKHCLWKAVFTKMPRKEAKIYQETDFLSTEGHLLTSSGCLLTLTSSQDVAQVRFAFVSFYLCRSTFRLQITTWQVLRTSCWVPLRVLLHSTDGVLKLTFSLLFCHAVAISSRGISIQSTQVWLMFFNLRILCIFLIRHTSR